MSLHILLEPEAASEVEDAAHWYEGQHPGLGLRFVTAVDMTIRHIGTWPGAAPRMPGLPEDLPVRRAPVNGFPYHVAYLATSEAVRVLAVAHDHRRPGYWRPRAES